MVTSLRVIKKEREEKKEEKILEKKYFQEENWTNFSTCVWVRVKDVEQKIEIIRGAAKNN